MDNSKEIDKYALILNGGKSSRMGFDKSTINYHGVDQLEYLASLLRGLDFEVFVSCRRDQLNLPHLSAYNKIKDDESFYVGEKPIEGPLVGILSAMKFLNDQIKDSKKFQTAILFVVAIDLPFISKEFIEELLDTLKLSSDENCYGVGPINPEKGWVEPLCTLYKINSYDNILFKVKQSGIRCPRKLVTLLKEDGYMVGFNPIERDSIINVNTQVEREEVLRKMGIRK